MASSSSSTTTGYATVATGSSDSSDSGRATPVRNPFICSCGDLFDGELGPRMFGVCGHNVCERCYEGTLKSHPGGGINQALRCPSPNCGMLTHVCCVKQNSCER